jgi:polyhydroxybutyrate depolymerase
MLESASPSLRLDLGFGMMTRRTWRRLLAVVAAATVVASCVSGASLDDRVTSPTTAASTAATTAITATTTIITTTATTTSEVLSETVYDPYAGTAAEVAATGVVSSGQVRTADGRARRYRLYVPTSVTGNETAPLLIALHGGLGSGEQFAANSGFDGLAEANGFFVVYPDGIGARPDGTGAQTWNGGFCCGPAARQQVDDVGFIRQLIDELEGQLPIDEERVVVAGHSNGAIMAYRLACELADRIAAIGVQAGNLGVDECRPSAPVSVLHLHGTNDTNVPIEGGAGSGIAGVVFRPARAAVEALAAADGCETSPAEGASPSNIDLSVTTWVGCSGGAMVRFVTVAGASHAWMGRPSRSAAAAGFVGEPYPDLDASRAIWSFFASLES